MKKILGVIAAMAATTLMAQDLPILPTGLDFDFANKNFNEQEAVHLMAKRAKSARVILSGENHYYSKFNSLAEYRFLRMMHENAGVRNFVIELSPTRAYFMERYFTKEDSIAKLFLMATSSKNYMNLFDSIAHWNRGLPPSEQIKVHGLDVERFSDMSILWLNDILKRRGTPPAELAAGVYLARIAANNVLTEGIENFLNDESDYSATSSFDTAAAVPINEIINSSDSARPQIAPPLNRSDRENAEAWRDREFNSLFESIPESNDENDLDYLINWLKEYGAADGPFVDSCKLWRNWLGTDYAEYVKVYRQLKEWQQWEQLDNTAQQYTWREEHMYRNMVALLNNNPSEKYYGQFGRCHTSLVKQQQDCGWFEYNSLLTRLRTRYFQNDSSVMSIGIFYVKDKDSDGDICAENLSNNPVINAEVKALYEIVNHNMLLFDMRASDSQLKELPKKFNFVLVHDQTEEDSEEPSDWNDYSIESFVNRYVSLTSSRMVIPQMMTAAMVQHFADNQYAVSNPRVFSYQLWQLGVHGSNMQLMMGAGFQSKGIFTGENGEKLQYASSSYVVDLLFHTNSSRNKWVIGLGGRAWNQLQRIKYTPPTLNILNPRPDGIKSIQNREWMPAAYLSVERRFANQFSLTFNVGYRKDLSTGKWYFQDSGLPYYNGKSIGGNMSSVFAELGLRINFIKDEE